MVHQILEIRTSKNSDAHQLEGTCSQSFSRELKAYSLYPFKKSNWHKTRTGMKRELTNHGQNIHNQWMFTFDYKNTWWCTDIQPT